MTRFAYARELLEARWTGEDQSGRQLVAAPDEIAGGQFLDLLTDKRGSAIAAKRQPLLAAVLEAARYGLYDLDRLERMILRRVAREYFLLDDGRDPQDD